MTPQRTLGVEEVRLIKVGMNRPVSPSLHIVAVGDTCQMSVLVLCHENSAVQLFGDKAWMGMSRVLFWKSSTGSVDRRSREFGQRCNTQSHPIHLGVRGSGCYSRWRCRRYKHI